MRPRKPFLHCLAALATLALSVCGCRESTQIDCQIVGHSMATAFKSEHSVATCDQCGFDFACDAVSRNTSEKVSVVCGNCGHQIVQKCLLQPADQVKLYPGQPVGRWDVVAFRKGERVLVKRVIGLPGETVDFREGNLLIGGGLVHKPQELRREVSTPVFDSNPTESQTSTTQVFERLVPRVEEAWAMSENAITHQARPVNSDAAESGHLDFDFLDYRHRRCYKNSDDPRIAVAIDDAYPFNQSIRRTPHPVDELDVRIDVSFTDKGSIQLERTTPKGSISASIELREDQTVALQLTRCSGGDIKTVEHKEIKVSGSSMEVRLINYDDLIHLLIDGMECVKPIRLGAIENPERFEVNVSQPVVSIGVSRADSVAIERVSIWRDWYLYQESPKPSLKLPLDTGEQGYYVVGDNLPVSEDSRHFGLVHDIIGVVKPVDDK